MRVSLLVPVLLAVGACSSPPPPSLEAGLGPDLAAARRLLLASDAPIPVVVAPAPAVLGPSADATVARLASQSTQWAAASFRPSTVPPISGPHLVMRFAGEGTSDAGGCLTTEPTSPLQGDPTRLRAMMCDGAVTVAEAVGVSTGGGRKAAESLVTDTTSRLFPSLGSQTSTSGWSYGTPGVSVGGWFGSGGGSGVGVGLGF